MWSWNKITKNGRGKADGELGSLADRPELQIRNLLDDPALRKAMGLDISLSATEGAAVEAEQSVTERPQRPFDRRRLLEAAAA